jgi:hypothetical protein
MPLAQTAEEQAFGGLLVKGGRIRHERNPGPGVKDRAKRMRRLKAGLIDRCSSPRVRWFKLLLFYSLVPQIIFLKKEKKIFLR